MTVPSEPLNPACDTYCDRCGDCLRCFGGDPCYAGGVDCGDHVWPADPDGES